jgi:flagellar L-ring protein precursor FlgH
MKLANAIPHTFSLCASTLRLSALGLAIACLGACAPLPQKVSVDFAEPKVVAAAATPSVSQRPTNGSIYQSSSYRPTFEDSRARLLGDIVTIQIVESLAASQVSASTVNRNTSMDTAITPPLPGLIGVDMKNLNMAAKTNNDFSGKGGTQAANTFTGSITATVIEVLPNGNLVVAGEKQIGVNQNVDVMRFSGTVDPRLLQPNNIINSTQVANVRVESRGRGAQGEAQTVGWISRFFLNFSPF